MNIVEKEQDIVLDNDIVKLLNENKNVIELIVKHGDILSNILNKFDNDTILNMSDTCKTINIDVQHKYTCQPKTWDELHGIIIHRIDDDGTECDLNDIDVSKIEDMSHLFSFTNFNGDISRWDVSHVKDTHGMFSGCNKFNCDISRWDVSNVENMDRMFWYCKNFRQNLDTWDVSNVNDMYRMFYECPTKPKWYDKDKFGIICNNVYEHSRNMQ